MTTTIDNITDKQIESLMTAAGQAGDEVQVHLCQLALGENIWNELDTSEQARVNRVLNEVASNQAQARPNTRMLAREACAWAIADAEGR